MLANKTRQEIEDFVIGVLAKAAKEGNTNAAGILAGFLARVQASEEAKEHEQRLEEFGQNTPKLAWYFARLGTTEQEAADIRQELGTILALTASKQERAQQAEQEPIQ